MTEKDRELIERAENTRRWDYRDIDELIAQAESLEAADILRDIQWNLYESAHETI